MYKVSKLLGVKGNTLNFNPYPTRVNVKHICEDAYCLFTFQTVFKAIANLNSIVNGRFNPSIQKILLEAK